jgi:hypothetical protein
MARAGSYALVARLGAESVHKVEGFVQRAGRLENLRMGRNSEKAAQDEVRNAKRTAGLQDFDQPSSYGSVVRGVFAKRIHQDVDVNQEHARRNPSSREEPRSRLD